MNELQMKIAISKAVAEGIHHPDTTILGPPEHAQVIWDSARDMMMDNTSAFCLMPEWMQDAMKLLDEHEVLQEMAIRSGEWLGGETTDAGEWKGCVYRLSPDYVFEEDEPTTADMLEQGDREMSDFGKHIFDLACGMTKGQTNE